MRPHLRRELPQWLILAAMLVAGAWAWPRVPGRMPVHWNFAGEVDRYGGKAEGLLLLPAVAAGLYVLFLVLPRLDPGRASYDAFRGAYAALRIGILAALGVIHLALVATALGWRGDASRVIVVAIGALFVLMGAVLGRVRPNWFVGIRTPWTLSSRRAWDATHRVGGRIFALNGAVMVVLGLIRPPWAIWAMLAGMLGGTAAMVVYSYVVWRADPERRALLGDEGVKAP